MGIFIQKNGTRYPIGGGTKQLEQRLSEIELSRASATGYGFVKLSDASGVTDSTGLALPASEKNAAKPGTMAGGISRNQAALEQKQQFYPSLKSLGITSAFLPDIIDAMPKNSVFRSNVNGTGIYDNPKNKIPKEAGVVTIEKTESYIRVLFTPNKSSASDGQICLASVNTNTKTVNGWYQFEGRLLEEESLE